MLKRSVHIFIVGLLALPGVSFAKGTVQLPATNQTTCFDSHGNTRTCSGSGEDGVSHAGVPWSQSSRFTDNGDGTVTDNLTGLVWSKHANAPSSALPGDQPNNCPNAETSMLWQEALDFIACLNAGNHAGSNKWRLPNLNELEGMVNLDVADSAAYLNASGFGFGTGLPATQVQPSKYWTATSDASGPANQSAAAAWDVDLANGDSFSTLKNELPRGVWPVSDGASTGPAQLRRTGQAVCFNDVGDARVCAATGEDGEQQAGAAWPASRFQVKAGAPYALDRVSGIIWTTNTQTPGPDDCDDTGLNLDWQQALDHVACLNEEVYLGRSDWRLPNRNELQSLADYSKGAPALPGGHPFSDQLGKTYWSGTTNSLVPTDAWVVRMLDGNISSADKAATLPVWPISGPDLVSPVPPTINPLNNLTNIASQTISGTMEEGTTVQVSVNGVPIATGVNVTGANWTAIAQLSEANNDITVTSTDFSENSSSPASTTVTLDTIPSVTTATPNPGTFTDRVTVSLATTEPGSKIYYTFDGTPVTTASPVYNGPITLTAANTSYKVQFFSVDSAGNVEATKSADYTMQETVSTRSMKINNGAQLTNLADVTLTLAAPTGVPQMQVACDGVTFAAAEPFSTTRSCVLSSGDGVKTVAVKFIDGLGIAYPPATATITLDTTPPVTSVTPIDGNYSGSVAVTLTATEAGSTIHYTTDGTTVTAASPVYSAPFTLAATTTTPFTVRFMAVDKAGNAGPSGNAAYTIHVGAASVGIKINNDDLYTNNATVNLALSATHSSGVSGMQFSNDGGDYTPLEPYASSKTWTLSGGDGIKTVYVRFKDGVGTLYTTSATINYSSKAASTSNCDLNGDNKVDMSDALKALQMAIGLSSPTMDEMIRGDVAPLVNGKPKPDGKIDITDAMVILQRSLGLVAAW
jgi:hypothetical protein